MTQVLPDDETYFSELLKGWGVQASVQQVLKERGFLTLSLLAHAVPARPMLRASLLLSWDVRLVIRLISHCFQQKPLPFVVR